MTEPASDPGSTGGPPPGSLPGAGIPPVLLAAALMRRYLVFFLPWAFRALHDGAKPLVMHWYLWAMCQAFQKVALGQTTRLVINVPPRNLKSITSVAFTAWMLGRDPSLKIMLVTYGASLAKEHIDNCRALMLHPVYRQLYPATVLLPGGKGELIIRTAQGGGCRSVTVGGATTGFGADIILIDDAMKAEDITSEARRSELERFFSGTLITRLNSKASGVVISIQQRLGEDDLPQRMIDAGAEHLNLPAYHDQEMVYDTGFGRRYRRPVGEVLRPDDENRAVLDDLKRLMGPHSFATQYLQQPSALEGNVIRTEAFGRFDLEDFERGECHTLLQSWDLATSTAQNADWSVCITAAHVWGKWHIVDVLRARMEYPELRDRVTAHALRWRADKVILEDAGAGQHLWQDLRVRGQIPVYKIRPESDKVTRMVGQLGLIEDGEVLLPDEAPWLDTFLREARAFPAVRNDDQVDALSQLLQWIKDHGSFMQMRIDPKTGRRYTPRSELHRRRR